MGSSDAAPQAALYTLQATSGVLVECLVEARIRRASHSKVQHSPGPADLTRTAGVVYRLRRMVQRTGCPLYTTLAASCSIGILGIYA